MSAPILRRFLYGLSPFDPVAYAAVAGTLMLAGAVATWIPVRRDMVDPRRRTAPSEVHRTLGNRALSRRHRGSGLHVRIS
jgi:hypothetical protein